jgi:predicted ATPase
MVGTTAEGVTGKGSMLLAFRAENVRSFRQELELSLLATRLTEKGVAREIPWREGGRPIQVLPTAGIFGANASGKSNLLKAMSDMRAIVLSSFRNPPDRPLESFPFLLGADRGEAPITYEVDLVLEGVRHEYGFIIEAGVVSEEWARSYPRGRAVTLLRRVGGEVHLGHEQRAKGRATEEILRPNALFLSTAAQTNHPQFLPLFRWFRRNLFYADVNSRSVRQAITAEMLEGDRRTQVLSLLREADLGITDVKQLEVDPEREQMMRKIFDAIWDGEPPEEVDDFEFRDFDVGLVHRSGEREVELPEGDESRGTLVWFGLIGLIIEALREGSVLLADELEASLHPALVGALVDLFQSPRSNPNRAQLIFNSHEVLLMGDTAERPLGRDQIWLTEKDEDGGSRLYSLAELAPRRGEAISRRYLAGRYGGVPILSRRSLEQIAEPVGDLEI